MKQIHSRFGGGLTVMPQVGMSERIKALDWQTRGIFEKMRDLFGWRLWLELPQADLAKQVGCSRAKLQKALDVLEADGLIMVHRERQNAKKMRCNRYYLTAGQAEVTTRQAEIDIREREREKNTSILSISKALSGAKNESSENGVSAVLAEYGVSERLYGELLSFGADEVRQALELASEKGAANVGGYALTCLKNGMRMATPKRRTVAADDYVSRMKNSRYAAWFEGLEVG